MRRALDLRRPIGDGFFDRKIVHRSATTILGKLLLRRGEVFHQSFDHGLELRVKLDHHLALHGASPFGVFRYLPITRSAPFLEPDLATADASQHGIVPNDPEILAAFLEDFEVFSVPDIPDADGNWERLDLVELFESMDLTDANADGLFSLGELAGALGDKAKADMIDAFQVGQSIDDLALKIERVISVLTVAREITILGAGRGGVELREVDIFGPTVNGLSSLAINLSLSDSMVAGLMTFLDANADVVEEVTMCGFVAVKAGLVGGEDGNAVLGLQVIDEDGVARSLTPGDLKKILDRTGDSTTGDPVRTGTGAFLHHQVDLAVPGRGLDFKFERHYDSRMSREGICGRGWSVPLLETRIVLGPTGTNLGLLDLQWGDGHHSYFVADDDPQIGEHYRAVGGKTEKILVNNGEARFEPGCPEPLPGWVCRTADGLQYIFGPPIIAPETGGMMVSYLRKVTDMQGNAIVLQRDRHGRVYQVIDTLRRHYFFDYDDDRGRLVGVRDPWGGTYQFHYDFEEHRPTGDAEEFYHGQRLVKGDLLRVDSPETLVTNDAGVVERRMPFVEYTYDEHPGGFAAHPDVILNHNLTSITTGDDGPRVVLTYGTNPAAYDYDRVIAHEVAGLTTEFRYEAGSNVEDAYGQTVYHVTTERTPEGVIKRFHHHADGMLLRREITSMQDTDGDFVPDGTHDSGISEYVTLYEYDADEQWVTAVVETTDVDPSGGRRTEYFYDTANPDRFQQSNLLSVTEYAADSSTVPSSRTRSMTYDPVTVRPNSTTDTLGRTSHRRFLHQEGAKSAAETMFGVDGWGINLDQTTWNLGDLNDDQEIGTTSTLGATTLGVFDVAREIDPMLTVAHPAGPTGPTSNVHSMAMHRYDVFGQMTGTRGPEGYWIEMQYHDGHLARTVVDPGGHHLVTDRYRDKRGRIVEQVGPDGRRTSFAYDDRNRIVEARQHVLICDDTVASSTPRDIVTQFFYDVEGRAHGDVSPRFVVPTSITDYGVGHGPVFDVVFDYDVAGRLVNETSFTRHAGQTTSMTTTTVHDSEGRPIERVMPTGAVLCQSYDTRGLHVATVRTDDLGNDFGTSHWDYDDLGSLVAEIKSVDSDGDGHGDRVEYVVDGYGRTIQTIDAEGNIHYRMVDAGDRVAASGTLNPIGEVLAHVDLQYDSRDRVVSKTTANLALADDGTTTLLDPPSVTTMTGYDTAASGPLWASTDPTGINRLTRYRYDSLGRATTVEDGSNADLVTTRVLDVAGRVKERRVSRDTNGMTGAINPSDVVWKNLFDEHGRPVGVVDPSGETTHRELDAVGRPIVRIDPRGNTVHFERDSRGRPRRTTEIGTDGLVRDVLRDYDDTGRLVGLVDGEGNRTEYDYDVFGRVIVRRFADQSEINYTYDDADRLVATAHLNDPQGTTVNYLHDAFDRVVDVFAVGADASVTRHIEYDGLGGMTSIEEQVAMMPPVTIRRKWSSLGTLLEQDLAENGSSFGAFAFATDDIGRMNEIVYPSGLTIGYDHDDLGRLETVSTNPGTPQQQLVSAATSHYGSFGPRVVLLGNGSRIEQDFDALGRSMRKETITSAQQVLAGATYAYDVGGNLDRRAWSSDGRVDTFTYDGFDRLHRYDEDVSATTGPGRSMTWTHDRIDNWVESSDTEVSTSASAVVNTLNQYTSFGATTIQHNSRGEEVSRQLGDVQATWQWDALGRPLTLQFANSNTGWGAMFEYRYDGLDRMFRRSSTSGDVVSWRHVGSSILESSHDGVSREYVRGPHGIMRLRGGTDVTYFHVDPFFNVEAIHDGASVLEAYRYDPFGRPRDLNGNDLTSSSQDNDLLFLGKPFDFETKLTRCDARHYNPVEGRFVRRDPLGEAAGLNLYGYPLQNPFRWVDPTGNGPEPTSQPATHVASTEEKLKGAEVLWGRTYSVGSKGLDAYVRDHQDELGLTSTRYGDLDLQEQLRVLSHFAAGTNFRINDAAEFFAGHIPGHIDQLRKGLVEIGRLTTGVLSQIKSDVAADLLGAAGEVGLSTIPGVGEIQDLGVLFGPDSSPGDRVFAGLSLVGNFFTGGLLPNYGGVARGARKVANAVDEARGASRTFAHGTSPDLGKNIVEEGLNEAAGRAAHRGGLENTPGSFHTVDVAQQDADELAAEFGLRRSDQPVVVLVTIPEEVFQTGLANGTIRQRPIRGAADFVETIFDPGSFDAVNSTSTRTIRPTTR